jgi:hypothetical protein
MLLERTLHGLQAQSETPERAEELGRMGFLQWLSFLKGRDSYPEQARRALAKAAVFEGTDPSVAVFCRLVRQSLEGPMALSDLEIPKPSRRGGARSRRRLM